PRNMVIGKLKYLIGPASGTISHPLGRSRFIFVRTYRCEVVGLCSRGGCSGSTDWKEKGKVAWAKAASIPMHVCWVPLARLKFDSELSASHGMRLLNVFGHT